MTQAVSRRLATPAACVQYVAMWILWWGTVALERIFSEDIGFP
jgi:hypothetical protein